MTRFDHELEKSSAGETQRQPLEDYIASIGDVVTHELEAILPTQWKVPENLQQAMMYSLMAGGKRLRPLLVISACEALGGSRRLLCLSLRL